MSEYQKTIEHAVYQYIDKFPPPSEKHMLPDWQDGFSNAYRGTFTDLKEYLDLNNLSPSFGLDYWTAPAPDGLIHVFKHEYERLPKLKRYSFSQSKVMPTCPICTYEQPEEFDMECGEKRSVTCSGCGVSYIVECCRLPLFSSTPIDGWGTLTEPEP